MNIQSTSEVLEYLYKLSLNQTDFGFRGQADESWKILPSIYRYCDFLRYQTTIYEKQLLNDKLPKSNPPLTHTSYDLEWLMVCQHYGIPTRLVDWSTDILSALFFACYEMGKNGALYICKQSDYPLISKCKESLANNQELAFISTNVMNPRMRNQSGCFMMWGHSPKINSTETYDLLEYHKQNGSSFFLEKLIIPSNSKKAILKELKKYYAITYDSIYLKNGFLETKYGNEFKNPKEKSRLITLYLTDADRLSEDEIKMLGGGRFNKHRSSLIVKSL